MPETEKERLYNAAVDCAAEGLVDEAIAKYRAAIALDEGYADAWHGLSMALAEKGWYAEAIEAGKKLVEIAPEDVLAYTNLSRSYQQAGNIPEAEAWAARARMADWKAQLRPEGPGSEESGKA